MPEHDPAPDEITAPYDRLRALGSYGVLDTAPDAALDGLVQLAAQLCDAPIGLITLVDEARQLFKARAGFDGPPSAALDVGFCPIVVERGEALAWKIHQGG